MFRIYANKDNEPATFSKDNVPYKAAYHLPVSIKGVQDGDFAMIMGYPGSTDRYLSSWGVQQKIGVEYPAFVASRDLKLKTMKKYMDADATVRIDYSPKYAQTANYWKNRIGMIKALSENGTVAKKEKTEVELDKWINETPERKKEYGSIFNTYKKYYSTTDATIAGDQYLMEAGLQGSSFGLFNFKLSQKLEAIAKATDEESKKKALESTDSFIDKFFDGINLPLEQELTSKMWAFYYKSAPIEQQPEEFVNIVTEYNNDFDALATDIFSKSVLTDRAKLKEVVANLDDEKTKETLKNDIGIRSYYSFIMKYISNMYSNPDKTALEGELSTAKRLYIKALREANPDKKYAPDANSTMRLTYGQVMSYEPMDGVEYKYYTTLKGVMQKEDPSNPEFVVAPKLKELYEKKDYGQYANADGTMSVGFLTNNDITGGNSGSPVINGKGELIGAAFDGNWEAMSGDIEFSDELQRTISVDVRYILFIIDKYAGATNLIDEMTIVK
ncbi:MAG: S46 family peptidase, partial [Flavobacteriales bacterium]|nr:S46 family peptidase [Flavobacteriales bacterium]